MRIRDYMSLAFDQLRRRKVVTALCAAGISIGCAAIIVAMSLGDSAQSYAEKEMNSFLRIDEITVTPFSAGGNRSGESNPNSDEAIRGQLTDQKLEVIRKLPHVKSALPMQSLSYMPMFMSDDRNNHVEVIATDLNELMSMGNTFRQGSPSDIPDTIVLNHGATFGLIDQQALNDLYTKLERDPFNEELNKQINQIQKLPASLYQKQVRFKYQGMEPNKELSSSYMRVTGILAKPANSTDSMAVYDKKAYVSFETAELLMDQLKLSESSGVAPLKKGQYNAVVVKVDQQDHVAKVEEQIKKLVLNTQTNLNQKDRLTEQFAIIRTIALGVGLFVLLIASISIVVAMTMSTYQRRRQIGIMKVLGANLGQIRNMFIIEAALLGFIGGLIGVLMSYWIVWGINGAVITATSSQETIIFIPFYIIPLGIFFAILTGVLSGIYPALSASKTDALTAIKRD